MLGFGALGQLSLGEIPRDPTAPLTFGWPFYPFNEPVRPRTRHRLSAHLQPQPAYAPDGWQATIDKFNSWYAPLRDPVRLPKRLGAGLNLYNALPFPVVPSPSNQLTGWFQEFRPPVWPKKGLKIIYQQTIAMPIRYLPRANVTYTLSAISQEGNDKSDMEFYVYTSPAVPVDLTAVFVSIEEIPATSGGSVSIAEDD